LKRTVAGIEKRSKVHKFQIFKGNRMNALSRQHLGFSAGMIGAWVAIRCAVFLAAAQSATGEIQYTITDLGTLGGNLIFVSAINDSGQVVGHCTTTGTSEMRAFIWNGRHMTNLGTLGGTNSYGFGINDQGQIVGEAEDAGGAMHGYLDQTGIMTALPGLGGSTGDARAINNSGQIAGGAWTTNDLEYHAYLNSGGIMTDIGTLGGTRSTAFAINGNGQVAGQASINGISSFHAFLYSGGSMVDLGTLGGSRSTAYGINNSGQVVGGAFTVTNSEHAFLYSDGTMTDLGTMGGLESRALGINDGGQIVGWTEGLLAEHAFVYDHGVMTDLNSVTDTNLGWTLELATAINNRGYIVGIGTHPAGTLRGFLLTPVVNLRITQTAPDTIHLQFNAQGNTGYVIEYSDTMASNDWHGLVVLDPIASSHPVDLTETISAGTPRRFYRVRVS
jgi:probable HAF family extracellular repeat protein